MNYNQKMDTLKKMVLQLFGNDIEKFVVALKRLTEDLNRQSYFRGDGLGSSYLEKIEIALNSQLNHI